MVKLPPKTRKFKLPKFTHILKNQVRDAIFLTVNHIIKNRNVYEVHNFYCTTV